MSALITIDSTADRVPISPEIYGQYLEHVEDCVEPGLITEQGLRPDVIAAAQKLEVPAVRWPGGCFADIYHWSDGIGPNRPVRPNWHWGRGELESNRFGTHEFLDWCEQVGAKPYVNVNLGTGSLTEALRWLDYCTGTADTADVAERRANGRAEPWSVPYWGIGNETWGTWEAGHTDATRYAETLANWAEFFHRYDPEATIVGVGSSEGLDPKWDRAVLDAAGAHLGLLSLHVYAATVIGEVDHGRPALAHFPSYVEQRINAMAEVVRQHNREHGRTIGIAMDEWNIRHWQATETGYQLNRADPRSGSDALCAAGFFHAMIKNADVVRLANYVFLVNGNGVIDARNGECRETSLFTIFQAYRARMIGEALPIAIDGPQVPAPQLASGNPDRRIAPEVMSETLPAVDGVACAVGDEIRLALINRAEDEIAVKLDDGRQAAEIDQYVVDPQTDQLQIRRVQPTDRLLLPPWSVTIAAVS